MVSKGDLPLSTKMTIDEADKELFRALGDNAQLVAVGKDETDKPVNIPSREWPYLTLFEERREDVLKYEPLDRQPAFCEVKLKRSDIQRLWPKQEALLSLRALVRSG